MKKYSFLIIIGMFISIFHTQSQFQLAIGGTNYDYALSIIQTSEGGYIAAGSTFSFGAGNYDMYVVKLDGSGTIQWSKSIGKAFRDEAQSIIQCSDGGYVLGGFSRSAEGYDDMLFIKLDGVGNLVWNKIIEGEYDEIAYSVIQTSDGGYIAAGYTDSFGAGNDDMYIIKFDNSGALQWDRTVGGTGYDAARSIIQTVDGGYIVAGHTGSFGAGSYDMYMVKLDGNGSVQWNRTIGGMDPDFARSITQVTAGTYVTAGYTFSFGAGNPDMYIVQFNESGVIQWSRTIGGADIDIASYIIKTLDGGYCAAGGTSSFGAGSNDIYLAKLDANGSLQWSRTVGGVNFDVGYSLIQITGGVLIAAGYSESFGSGGDINIVNLDANGNTCGNSTNPPSQSGVGGVTTSPVPSVTTPSVVVTTPIPTFGSGGSLVTICIVGIQPISNEIPYSYSLSQNYPNPFNPATRFGFRIADPGFVTIKILNASGQEISSIVSENLRPGTYEADWDATNFPSGVYFYQLTVSSEQSTVFKETKKMVLVK